MLLQNLGKNKKHQKRSPILQRSSSLPTQKTEDLLFALDLQAADGTASVRLNITPERNEVGILKLRYVLGIHQRMPTAGGAPVPSSAKCCDRAAWGADQGMNR